MNGLGLSPEALERRRKYVTASDAKPIMEGVWPEVYRSKMGAPGEDLSGVLPVQLGSYTEPFCLAWYQRVTRRSVDYYTDSPLLEAIWQELSGGDPVTSEFVISKEHPFMACSLDALSTTSQGFPCVLDAKHVGTFRHDELVERYTPAGVHQAIVCGVDWWCLAVLIGNGKFEVIEQEVDVFYRERLIAREREFWSWVERKEEPPDYREPVAPPKPQPKLRRVEMPLFTDPGWQDFAQRNNFAVDLANEIMAFTETQRAHNAHMAAREGIKALIPEDVGELVRGPFTAKRSRAGAVTMTLAEKGDG